MNMVDSVREETPEDAALGERLKQFRESVPLDQKAMAKQVGAGFRTYQEYEAGRSAPKVSVLRKLMAMGCDLTWLLTGVRAASGKPEPWAHFSPDEELLGRVTDMVARAYSDAGRPLSMVDLGRLSAEKYKVIVDATDDPEERFTMVKLTGAQLRKDLIAEQPGSGKRSA
ncbi:Uncharacterised protein [Starkeya nomas]|uniref:HTH cro/C1-type domain-containing protein n=1 Tax=Starkeya nomas TaxID=2666134 RepID=A0A5S9Q5D9_9HYPH|nr:helix-turn-helix transcriptional regulator [Starkeya nomas]CAA0112227.1 Uncharacterised protein [Starkeya nomas]